MQFDLLSPNSFRMMKFGVPDGEAAIDVFKYIIEDEIDIIADKFGCEANVSAMRLLDIQQTWVKDLQELRIRESAEPCHLKHAGWLSHWIRKKQPIVGLTCYDTSKLNESFEHSCNETVAFMIGLKASLYYECSKRMMTSETIKNSVIRSEEAGRYDDYITYLMHKSVSPHAIFLIFKALVSDGLISGGSKPILAFASSNK